MKLIVANIPIELSGNGDVYNNISKELSGFPETNETPEVIFRISTKIFEIPHDVTVASDILYNARYFVFKHTSLNFEIKGRAFEKGQLGVMDYNVIKNIQADTQMKMAIALDK